MFTNETACASDPNYAESFNNLGNLFKENEETIEAIDAYQKADGTREYPCRSCTAFGLNLRQAHARNGWRNRYRPHLVRCRKTSANLLHRLNRQRHSQHGGHRGM